MPSNTVGDRTLLAGMRKRGFGQNEIQWLNATVPVGLPGQFTSINLVGATATITGPTELTITVTGGGSTSPLTTKGDIWGYSTVDARVPVGANDLPLVADSTAALGVAYKVLPITGGGTGQITANAALNALLPNQATHAGEALITDGTNASWSGVGAAGSVCIQLGPSPGTTAPIVATQVLYFQCPANYTFTGWQIYVFPAATVSADVRVTTFGATLPVAGDSITAGHPITTTASQTNTGVTTLWGTTAVTRGKWIAIALTANDVGKFISIELQGTKT